MRWVVYNLRRHAGRDGRSEVSTLNVMAINGSPRKNWNTATLLNKALEGAASQGATTELVHLYDLNYKGCVSCFSCKLKGGKSYGKCAHLDDLTSILEKIDLADAVILGSPVYLGTVTGEMRSLLERMVFPYLVYDKERSSLAERKKPIGLIYTMNMKDSRIKEGGYDHVFNEDRMFLERIFGSAATLFVTDTYQFDDYSKYVASVFDEAAKAQRRREVFPSDCEKAFEMGAGFVSGKGILRTS